eukprot:5378689-Prymnesium_polylepis.1
MTLFSGVSSQSREPKVTPRKWGSLCDARRRGALCEAEKAHAKSKTAASKGRRSGGMPAGARSITFHTVYSTQPDPKITKKRHESKGHNPRRSGRPIRGVEPVHPAGIFGHRPHAAQDHNTSDIPEARSHTPTSLHEPAQPPHAQRCLRRITRRALPAAGAALAIARPPACCGR